GAGTCSGDRVKGMATAIRLARGTRILLRRDCGLVGRQRIRDVGLWGRVQRIFLDAGRSVRRRAATRISRRYIAIGRDQRTSCATAVPRSGGGDRPATAPDTADLYGDRRG